MFGLPADGCAAGSPSNGKLAIKKSPMRMMNREERTGNYHPCKIFFNQLKFREDPSRVAAF